MLFRDQLLVPRTRIMQLQVAERAADHVGSLSKHIKFDLFDNAI